ncbi:DUF6777 domain-containing protein [Streptomyces sp. NPDC093085]|uniref:DUF6777 domain-containing protein n=1 Tax=Streptomyces sp. NPDC093085 TaxID=3155068 RepID=UPI003449CCF9
MCPPIGRRSAALAALSASVLITTGCGWGGGGGGTPAPTGKELHFQPVAAPGPDPFTASTAAPLPGPVAPAGRAPAVSRTPGTAPDPGASRAPGDAPAPDAAPVPVAPDGDASPDIGSPDGGPAPDGGAAPDPGAVSDRGAAPDAGSAPDPGAAPAPDALPDPGTALAPDAADARVSGGTDDARGPGRGRAGARSAATAARAPRALPGSTPGLYGGSPSASCDVKRQADLLAGDPAKSRAFAQGASLGQQPVADFLRGLTPVVVRADVRVTAHGYRDGAATSFQSVLQAGTAVLVDEYGMPRVRCAGGSPVGAPVAAQGSMDYRGTPWKGYAPERVVVVNRAPRPVDALIIVDLVDHAWVERRIGTDGGEDRPPQDPPPYGPEADITDPEAVRLPGEIGSTGTITGPTPSTPPGGGVPPSGAPPRGGRSTAPAAPEPPPDEPAPVPDGGPDGGDGAGLAPDTGPLPDAPADDLGPLPDDGALPPPGPDGAALPDDRAHPS